MTECMDTCIQTCGTWLKLESLVIFSLESTDNQGPFLDTAIFLCLLERDIKIPILYRFSSEHDREYAQYLCTYLHQGRVF